MKRDGKTTSSRQGHLQSVGRANLTTGDPVCLRIGSVIGVRSIGIDYRLVMFALFEKVQRDVECPTVFIRDTAGEPLSRLLGLTCHNNIVTRFSQQVFAPTPIDGHLLDKLEGIGEQGVMFGQVGSHLQR